MVDAKTGRVAPDPNHPATRRQLLEYQIYYAAHAVYLYDGESDTLKKVCFPQLPGSRRAMRTGVIIGIAVGAAATAAGFALQQWVTRFL